MPNILKVKKSSVPNKMPAVGDLALGELAVNTNDGRLFMKKDNGVASIVEIGAGGGASPALARSANFTAVVGTTYLVDTTSARVDVTLPTSPTVGDRVAFVDAAGNFHINPLRLLYVAPNNIIGLAEFCDITVQHIPVTIIFTSTGWRLAEFPTLTQVTGSGTGGGNRIINGRMEIDQRNNGAAVTVNDPNNARFGADRWWGIGQSADGVFTVQRQSGGPPGFSNFLRATVTTADASIGATQSYLLANRIEGNLISDLAWGAASAQTVTLRFWVRSSLSGAFSGIMRNAAADRSYPFSYTIIAANTWELKTVTVTGDTTGTWPTDTSTGIQLFFDLGSGSNARGTAGAWVAAGLIGVTGAVSLISTISATFDLTGVELVRASSDLGPSWRPFVQELDLCRRYARSLTHEQRLNSSAASNFWTAGVPLSPPMRATPTATQTAAGTLSNLSAATCVPVSAEIVQLNATTTAAGDAYVTGRTYLLSSEL
jgi:hypothetical protein